MSWKSTPACFDSAQQWEAWHVLARSYPPPARDGFCADCTPTYQREMKAHKRCQYPGTTFRLVVEGDGVDIQGVRNGG